VRRLEAARVEQLQLLVAVCAKLRHKNLALPINDPGAIALGLWMNKKFGPARHSGRSAVQHAGRVLAGLREDCVLQEEEQSRAKALFIEAASELGIAIRLDRSTGP
jgi:hypothetical protein